MNKLKIIAGVVLMLLPLWVGMYCDHVMRDHWAMRPLAITLTCMAFTGCFVLAAGICGVLKEE